MRIKMQMRFVLLLSALFVGSAQADVVDTITGFGDTGDFYRVNADQFGVRLTAEIGVDSTGTPGSDLSNSNQLATTGVNVWQDYRFTNITSDTSVALSILDGDEPNGFNDLVLQVYSDLGTTLYDSVALVTSGAVNLNYASLGMDLTGLSDIMIRVLANVNVENAAYAGYELIVSAVPVPAAGLLFGSALLGFIGLGRRKDKDKALAE